MKLTHLVIFSVLLFVTAFPVSLSAVPVQAEAAGVIYACANPASGTLKIVQGPTCGKNETLVWWNQTGPSGPAGQDGATGPAGPIGPAGPAGPAGGRSLTSQLIGQVAEFQDCSILLGCQMKQSITLNMSEGSITFDAVVQLGGPGVPEEVAHFEITKQFEEVLCGNENCAGENDYRVRVKVVKGIGAPFVRSISPSSPVYNSEFDEYCALHPTECLVPFKAALSTDSLLTLTITKAPLILVTTEAVGGILAAGIAYDEARGADVLTVRPWNAGDAADFLITVDSCTGVVPLAAKVVRLNAQEVGTARWTLQARDPANQSGGHVNNPISCTVTLLTTSAMLLDSTIVSRGYPY